MNAQRPTRKRPTVVRGSEAGEESAGAMRRGYVTTSRSTCPFPMAEEVKNYMTPGGYRRLREELAHLWKVERPAMVTTVAWAAGNGDRSENGDYIYGKRKLREIDRRIRHLSK